MILYLTRLTLPAAPSDRHRTLSVGAHRLLSYALTRAGYDPATLILSRAASGKPYLTMADGKPAPVEFSLTHSGNWAVCALAAEASASVGVDLERIRSVSPSLWRHYLAVYPDEPVGDDYTAILRWTRYEAALKQKGSAPEAMPPETAFRTLHPIPGYLLTVIGEGEVEFVRFAAERELCGFDPL